MQQGSIDLITLGVAAVLMTLAAWTAVTTRSRVIRVVLIAIMFIMLALMLWNLAIHGGMHAV
jgi:hypothetical protein